MHSPRCLALSLFSLSLLCLAARAPAADDYDGEPISQVTDQIVRLSYVQGDVRVARGKAAEHATGGDWGQAVENLPLLTGFSLVTGDGRAEIELEDASTVYLGPNSVLTLDLLADQGPIPHTVLTLVSGTATLHVAPDVEGETFVLATPTSRFALVHGGSTFLRVDSYLDATRYTPMAPSDLSVNDGPTTRPPAGQSLTYFADRHSSQQAGPPPGSATDPMAGWDSWVLARVHTRDQEMAAAMRDAHLSEPLPGLDQLERSGHFFGCAPYGTCWTPNPVPGTQAARFVTRANGRPHVVMAAQFLPAQYIGPSGLGPNPYSPFGPNFQYTGFSFPCLPGGLAVIPSARYNGFYPNSYDWTVCNAGTWLPTRGNYVWLVGKQKHHHCPIRWVKYNGKPAFVPLHPGDIRGKPPLNLGHGIFILDGKKTFDYTHDAAGASIKPMNEAPGEFRSVYYPTLHAVAAPQPVAHMLDASAVRSERGAAKPVLLAASEPIRISDHGDAFSVHHEDFSSGRTHTVNGRFGGSAGVARAASPEFSGIHGGFSVARGSSFSGGGAASRVASSSGASGGSARGGSSSGGGGSRGGGGGASSGGGGSGHR